MIPFRPVALALVLSCLVPFPALAKTDPPAPRTAQPESAESRIARAQAAYANGDHGVIRAELLALAEQGYPQAAFLVGDAYYNGYG